MLFDGAPLNDPFGGWVYWNRLPLSGLEAVEVARGALSQLYGSAAMGGAIQLLPRAPAGYPGGHRPGRRPPQPRRGDFGGQAARDEGSSGWTLAGRQQYDE